MAQVCLSGGKKAPVYPALSGQDFCLAQSKNLAH